MAPPRLIARSRVGLQLRRLLSNRSYAPQCLICQYTSSLSHRPSSRRFRTQLPYLRRQQSSVSIPSTSSNLSVASNPRAALKAALLSLQKQATSYVSLSRLQLALRGLDQIPGRETIRVAILGLGSQEQTAVKARELARLLLADPLAEPQEWETSLLAEDLDQPVLLKVGAELPEEGHVHGRGLVKEIHVSSPILNEHNLEILILQSEALDGEDGADNILVPMVDIPTTSTGRYTPVSTPVHMAVLLGDGILGATSLMKLSQSVDSSTVVSAVDMPGHLPEDGIPFEMIDIGLAGGALASFRRSVDNALDYERDWYSSGLPTLSDWIKSSTASKDDQLKAPITSLISSIVADTSANINKSEASQLSRALDAKVSTTSLTSLNADLTTWAQRAHTELRDTLETAFAGRRWRKLGWWKLFWRVDDVSMIASDILLQRFMPEAEKEIIYLAGKISEAGVIKEPASSGNGNDWAYKTVEPVSVGQATLGTVPEPPRLSQLVDPKDEGDLPSLKPQPWPLHIPVARGYLLSSTIPTLQALAQKLVLQTLTTSSFAIAFSVLIYIADSTTGVYESGAVAALGTVWALRRMQGKWETARGEWESEVREQGRTSIRAVEGIVGSVLKDTKSVDIEGRQEILQARRAVEVAERALEDIEINGDK